MSKREILFDIRVQLSLYPTPKLSLKIIREDVQNKHKSQLMPFHRNKERNICCDYLYKQSQHNVCQCYQHASPLNQQDATLAYHNKWKPKGTAYLI